MRSSASHPSDEANVFHPYNIMLSILLMGLCGLFLALTASYIYIRVTNGIPPVRMPWLFVFNTLVLMGSSFSMVRARQFYLTDNTAAYQRHLGITIFLSIVFVLLQGVAWYLLFLQNISLNTSATAAFLYVISFVHMVHVLGGLPFLFLFYRSARKRMTDPVTVLIYFSDPEKRLRLKLLTRYWHFLDILWVYLVLFFLINWLF